MPGNFSYIIPGKLAGCAKPGGWSDPRSDLSGLARLGIGAIVSLTEEKLDPLALQDFGFRYLHLPIPDFMAPAPAQIRDYLIFVDACLDENIAVATHCGAGIGRTGTMLACYLVHLGASPAEAVAKIRRERPGSIETAQQEQSIGNYFKKHKDKPGTRR